MRCPSWHKWLLSCLARVGSFSECASPNKHGRSPEEGRGNPVQLSPPGNPMDRGACWATVMGSQESDTTQQLDQPAQSVLEKEVGRCSKPRAASCPWRPQKRLACKGVERTLQKSGENQRYPNTPVLAGSRMQKSQSTTCRVPWDIRQT